VHHGKQSKSPQSPIDEKPPWSTPTVELLELCEIESAADLDVAFTTVLTSGDL
jgi:hypothetical protein